MIHQLRSDDSDEAFSVLREARERLAQSGPKRLRHTLPPIAFQALKLVPIIKAREGDGQEVEASCKTVSVRLQRHSRRSVQSQQAICGCVTSAALPVHVGMVFVPAGAAICARGGGTAIRHRDPWDGRNGVAALFDGRALLVRSRRAGIDHLRVLRAGTSLPTHAAQKTYCAILFSIQIARALSAPLII